MPLIVAGAAPCSLYVESGAYSPERGCKYTQIRVFYMGGKGLSGAVVNLIEPFTVGNLTTALRDLAQHLEDAES